MVLGGTIQRAFSTFPIPQALTRVQQVGRVPPLDRLGDQSSGHSLGWGEVTQTEAGESWQEGRALLLGGCVTFGELTAGWLGFQRQGRTFWLRKGHEPRS